MFWTRYVYLGCKKRNNNICCQHMLPQYGHDFTSCVVDFHGFSALVSNSGVHIQLQIKKPWGNLSGVLRNVIFRLIAWGFHLVWQWADGRTVRNYLYFLLPLPLRLRRSVPVSWKQTEEQQQQRQRGRLRWKLCEGISALQSRAQRFLALLSSCTSPQGSKILIRAFSGLRSLNSCRNMRSHKEEIQKLPAHPLLFLHLLWSLGCWAELLFELFCRLFPLCLNCKTCSCVKRPPDKKNPKPRPPIWRRICTLGRRSSR